MLNNGWTVPRPRTILEVRTDSETVIVVRRHGNPEGPRLVLCHGNGLAIDLYYPFWSLLADEFDLFVFDLRNHGWNSLGSRKGHSLIAFASDQDTVLDAINAQCGSKPTIGVFHSVSALACMLSSSRGAGFATRILFDPPVCRADESYEAMEAVALRLAALARRRTNRFSSVEQYADLLAFMPIFGRAVPGLLPLVARTTLRAAAGGAGYELRCPPEYEAQIIDYARSFAVLVDFDASRCPTKVIGADPTLPFSYLPTLDLSGIESVDYDFVPESTHLLQLEKPEVCVALVKEYLAEAGLA